MPADPVAEASADSAANAATDPADAAAQAAQAAWADFWARKRGAAPPASAVGKLPPLPPARQSTLEEFQSGTRANPIVIDD